jgi:hypothetical protein
MQEVVDSRREERNAEREKRRVMLSAVTASAARPVLTTNTQRTMYTSRLSLWSTTDWNI